MSTALETYKSNTRRRLQALQAEAIRIADTRDEARRKIDRRPDLDDASKRRLREIVDRASLERFAPLRDELDKLSKTAKETLRKVRRFDAHDAAMEMRVAAAAARWLPHLSGREIPVETAAEKILERAVADDDVPTLLALRRELPALAERQGRPLSQPMLDRLDLLPPFADVREAVVLERELDKAQKRIGTGLGVVEAELKGEATAGVVPGFDEASTVYRAGFERQSDGSVSYRPTPPEAQERADDQEAEYRRVFGLD